MGLLDGVVENVVNSALKGGSKPGAANPLGDLLGNLVNGSQAQATDGPQGLDAGKLLAAGFALLQQNGGVVGLVDNLSRNGLADQASSSMSQLLPELINQLTLKGDVSDDHADFVSQRLSMLLGKS